MLTLSSMFPDRKYVPISSPWSYFWAQIRYDQAQMIPQIPSNHSQHPLVVAIDLGGTNVRGAILENGRMLEGTRLQANSRAQEGSLAVIEATAGLVREICEQSPRPVSAIGLSIPGHADPDTGVVRWSPNFGEYVNGVFKYWIDVSFGGPLSEITGLPVYMHNDANLAALGEYQFGAGKAKAKCLVMLTLGTGVGGGVVLGKGSVLGKAESPLVLVGCNHGGAELGHISLLHGGLDTSAGSYGCLEAYCRKGAITERMLHRLRRGRESILRSKNWEELTPEDLSIAADQGDELSQEVLSEIGTWLGVGIGSHVNVFAPDVFVLAGQIAKAGKWLIEPAIRSARNVAIPNLWEDVTVAKAELGDDAGIIGAGCYAAMMQN